MDCSKINTGFAMDACGKLALAGTAARVILLNYSDISRSLSVVTDNVISEIILKAGAKAYEVDSLPNATVGEDTVNAGTYVNTHVHSATVRIFKKSEVAKAFINGLTNSLVVAIVENNDHGDEGETKYEVYGWDSGLELSAINATTELTDDAAYVATLSTGDTARESTLPKSFFNTDEETTDAAIEALITPTPETPDEPTGDPNTPDA